MIDSHCHLADETFAADLDEVVDARKARRARARPRHSRGRQRRRKPRRPRASASCGPRCACRSASTRIRRTSSPAIPAARRKSSEARCGHAVGAARSARSASTTTTISRRAMYSRRVFRAQLRLARELDLPVVIHTREADEDTLRDPAEEGGGRASRRPALLHRDAGARRRRPRARLLHLAGRHHHVSEGAGTARHRAPRPARPAADRDRQSVSGAGAASRQAQRTGATSAAWSRALAELHGIARPTIWRARTAGELSHAVPAVIKS